MVESGYLHRVHRGVYIVGHLATDPYAYATAAILACAPQAMLSHPTATRLWGLPVGSVPEICVTVVGRNVSSRDGLITRSIGKVERKDVRRLHGLPVTSPALTLLDLAGAEGKRDLRKALNEARVQRLVTDAELHATADRHSLRRGAAAIKRLLESEVESFVTESEAEALCLRLMHEHGISPDETQALVGGYRVDFLYRRERLIVEVDGYRFHSSHGRFVEDRRRAAALGALGYVLHPFSWVDLTDSPSQAMSRLAAALDVRRKQLAA